MALRFFGTDGVRGKAGEGLTEDFARSLGEAAGRFLLDSSSAPRRLFDSWSLGEPAFWDDHRAWSEDLARLRRRFGQRPTVALGYDTRVSSPSLAEAVGAGLRASGADVLDLGIVPTAVVAFAVAHLGLEGGCVVSASHNPPEDNGIKFFGSGGYKLSVAEEEEIESLLLGGVSGRAETFGRARSEEGREVAHLYEDYTVAAARAVAGIPASDRRRAGPKVVLDCANGAAFRLGPTVLRRVCADVVSIEDSSDGSKINVGCGATVPARVSEALSSLREQSFEVGLSLDGDADRLVATDPRGVVYDGDHLMAAFALWMREHGMLDPAVVVATVMSNLGLRLALAEAGIELVECQVGDRQVVEAVRTSGARLGGEQSGHIVFSDLATTGDGILTAAVLAAILGVSSRPLSELAGRLPVVPQVLLNVKVADKERVVNSPSVRRAVEAVRERLGESGRIVVRPSGTEPVVRVMVEAVDGELAQRLADEVASVVSKVSAVE